MATPRPPRTLPTRVDVPCINCGNIISIRYYDQKRHSGMCMKCAKKEVAARKIAKTEKLLELLKYDEKYVSGQRNKTLYSYGRYFIDLGFDSEEVKELLLWVNNSGDSIPEDEIYRTVFKSLRIL